MKTGAVIYAMLMTWLFGFASLPLLLLGVLLIFVMLAPTLDDDSASNHNSPNNHNGGAT